MRRRLLFLVALAVLAASLAVPSLAAVGKAYSMKLGSTFTITGRTGSGAGKHTRAVGKVVLVGPVGRRPVARAHDDDRPTARATTGSRSSRAAVAT